MPHSACRLLAAALVLTAGCASPLFSGLSSHGSSDSGPEGQSGAAETASRGTTRNSQSSERTAAESHTAAWEKPNPERRITELLAAASKSQRVRNFADARDGYEQVLRLDSRNLAAHYQLACIADDEGRFADAEGHYFAMLKQTPGDPNVLASLGWSYLLQGRYEDSERTLRDALHYAPTHQTALYNLGWLYGVRGDDDQALAIFRSAGTEAEAQRALAELKLNTGAGRPLRAGLSQKPQAAAREAPATNRVSAPAPWNDGQAAAGEYGRRAQSVLNERPAVEGQGSGNAWATSTRESRPVLTSLPPGQDRTSHVPTNGMFSEIDAYADSSPSQANRAGLAEPQAADIPSSAGALRSDPIRSEGARPINYENRSTPQAGLEYPRITPRAAGAGTSGVRSAPTARADLPADELHAGNSGSSRVPPAVPGNWSNVASSAPAEGLPTGAAPDRGSSRWQDAQTTAAQIGLSAGPGAPAFAAFDWTGPTASAALRDSRPMPPPQSRNGAWPQPAVGATAPLQPAATPRQPAGTPPAALTPTSPPQTIGMPPWPGRQAIPAPIPTDVVPMAPSPDPRTGDPSVAPSFYSGRTPANAPR